MRHLNTFMATVAVVLSVAVLSYDAMPMSELTKIHPAPEVLAASVMADIQAANPYDHWSTLRDHHQGRRPNVMRTIMGMGAVSLQGPGSTSGNPKFITVSVPQSSGIMCYRTDLACTITSGQVAFYYDSGNSFDLYVAGANRMTISNSNGNMVVIPATTFTVNGTTSGVFNPNIDSNWFYIQSPTRVQANFAVDGTIQSVGANDITSGHSFITSSTTGGVAVTGVGGVYQMTNMFTKNTAPTISSGFGSSPSIVASNGSLAFQINVGTGGVATSGVIGLPTAATGWICKCDDITTENTTVTYTKQTASSTTSCTVGNFTDIAGAGAWAASDKLNCTAVAY